MINNYKDMFKTDDPIASKMRDKVNNIMRLSRAIENEIHKYQYLELCYRYEAPIPASDLMRVEHKDEIRSSIPDPYGRLRTYSFTKHFNLIHKDDEWKYVLDAAEEKGLNFPHYPLDSVIINLNQSQYDLMK